MLQNDVSLKQEAVIRVIFADGKMPACSGESLLHMHCEATVDMSAVRWTRCIDVAATGAKLTTDPRVVVAFALE
jgi:hypothetical protein